MKPSIGIYQSEGILKGKGVGVEPGKLDFNRPNFLTKFMNHYYVAYETFIFALPVNVGPEDSRMLTRRSAGVQADAMLHFESVCVLYNGFVRCWYGFFEQD